MGGFFLVFRFFILFSFFSFYCVPIFYPIVFQFFLMIFGFVGFCSENYHNFRHPKMFFFVGKGLGPPRCLIWFLKICILLLAQGQQCFFFPDVACSGSVWNNSSRASSGRPESRQFACGCAEKKIGSSARMFKISIEVVGRRQPGAPLTGPADLTLVRMDFQPSQVATNEAFLSACAGGRATKVEHLLHAPQNPDARDARNNYTGIHWAARNGHLAIVRLLLEAGADKDAGKQNGITALQLASLYGHLGVVRLLLEAGADKDAAIQVGATAIHAAAENGHLNIVRLLLDARADKDAARQDGARWHNGFARSSWSWPFGFCAIAAGGWCRQGCSNARWHDSFALGSLQSPFKRCWIAAGGRCWRCCRLPAKES